MSKGKRSSILFFAGLLSALFCCNCSHQPSSRSYVKEGREYGTVSGAFFRHRWWNFYERGLSFAEGEYYSEALADLTKALESRARDQRMARTYGMHFVDYFPHRELGIIYYQMGDLEKAERELEISLSQFPSAKAYFYLDRVRKSLIEGLGIEISPPKVTLHYMTDEFWSKEDPIVLSGVAEDSFYIAEITVKGISQFIEGSQKLIPFEELLSLPQGRHSIEVEAKNLLGKSTKREVLIHIDREGPTVTLSELRIEDTLNGTVHLVSGWIYDKAGIRDLTIGGQSVALENGVEAAFSEKFTRRSDVLDLITHDRLGNRTCVSLPGGGFSAKSKPVLLASRNMGDLIDLSAGLFQPRDIRPPVIRLQGWTETQIVFLEKAYIEGQVSDENMVESLTINQTSILHRKGLHIFFSYMADLEEGENKVIVAATDAFGNKSSKEITILRRVPQAFQSSERLSLTIFPFEQSGGVSESSLAFQHRLVDALVDRNRFQVVERSRLDMVLGEQNLSSTQLFDQRTALKLGNLAAAQSIVTGSIVETSSGIEVVARLIDTETSEILSTQDVYGELKDLPALRFLAEGMAVKFHRDFPLANGFVMERKGREIFTSLGNDMTKLQRRLIVYREEPMKHPETGKPLGIDNRIIGHARVTQIMSDISKAALLDFTDQPVTGQDRVIAQ